MKKIVLGLALSLVAPALAHAADASQNSGAETKKEKCCCCDKKGDDHADHKDMQN